MIRSTLRSAAVALMLCAPAALVPVAAQAAGSVPAAPTVSFSEAEQLVKAGNYEDAIPALKALDDGRNADVLNYLGYAHRKIGQWRAAQTYYVRALEVDPGHIGALEYYGEWHVERGDIAGAESYLQRLQDACGTCAEYRELQEVIADAKSS